VELKTETIHFRLSPAERKALEAQAHYRFVQYRGRGMDADNLTEYLRFLVRVDGVVIDREIARRRGGKG